MKQLNFFLIIKGKQEDHPRQLNNQVCQVTACSKTVRQKNAYILIFDIALVNQKRTILSHIITLG